MAIINGVFKNIALLVSGTAVAQLINFCFIPLITRLYGPESYGMMGSLMAFINIMIPIASLSFPIAIVLPKSDKTAIYIAYLSICIGLVGAGVLLILIEGLEYLDGSFSQYPEWYILLLPFIMAFLPLQQSGQQWLIRKKQFKEIAKVSVSQALIMNGLKVIGGGILPTQIMIIYTTGAGVIFQCLQFFYRSYKKGLGIPLSKIKKNNFIRVARSYYDFPLYRTPQVLINALSQNLPIFLLGYYFDSKIVGFYVLAQTLLTAPVTLLSTSISNVYYPAIAEKFTQKKPIYNFLRKTILGLFIVSLFIYLPCILLSGIVFKIIFGSGWITSSIFFQWMAIYCIFWLSARPAMDTIPPLKIQNYFLLYEVISFLLRILSLMLGYYLYKDAIICIIMFSLTNAVTYAILIVFILFQAKVNDRKYT
ncbi:oligosaccharide flippase family protein [Escherichia albertii]|uniref:oligosaccharide flippase family protein n=1 Tax=Escherichia albertii TaxID=208962 RepID=UPI0021D423DD|nr:oligosaccharide flippase family protein [Escherichia albertii]MCU7310441.1 oligosaccharide flippase family protein [Escherichia albertii]MCZ8811746.1 oligosaccharide flippase family protein [Escherichia albertii]